MLHGCGGPERASARENSGHIHFSRASHAGRRRDFHRARRSRPRGTGITIPDLPIFVAVGETTCCVGDMFALVVADTAFHARQAADKVKIDYEVLPPVTDPFAALEPGAPQVHAPGNLHVHPNLLEATAFARGDVDAALAASTHVIEQTFATQPIEPAFLEPEAASQFRRARESKYIRRARGPRSTSAKLPRVLQIAAGRRGCRTRC